MARPTKVPLDENGQPFDQPFPGYEVSAKIHDGPHGVLWAAHEQLFDREVVIRQFTPTPREEIVLATKVFFPMRPGPNGRGLSRKAILSEIDNSLKRLDTDYVDLYQIHRFDPFTPVEERLVAPPVIVAPTGLVNFTPKVSSPS